MTVVADPLARAQAARTARQAAALRDQLEVELALNTELPAQWETQADQALAQLRARFPTMDETFDHGQAGGLPTLSRGARRELERGAEQAAGQGGKAGAQRTPSGPTSPAAARRAPGRPRRGRGGRLARRAWRDTGIPAAGRETSRLVLGVIGGVVLLTLLYRLLADAQRSAPGRSAVEVLSGLSVGALQLLFSSTPPLSGARLTGSGRVIPPPGGGRSGGGLGSVFDAAAALSAPRRRKAPARRGGPASALPARRPAETTHAP